MQNKIAAQEVHCKETGNMPGADCCIVNCGTSRYHKDISLFKIPTPKDDANIKWRREMMNVITRDREHDASFTEQIDKDKLHICERHFSPEQFYICK